MAPIGSAAHTAPTGVNGATTPWAGTGAITTVSTQHEGSAGLFFRFAGAHGTAAAGATCAIAYSASAVIVRDGLTPGLAGIAAPSQTIRLR